MDDILILTNNRYALHRAIKKVYSVIDTLKLTLAKNKTFIGTTSKEFTFLGFRLCRLKPTIAPANTTINKSAEKLLALFKKGADNKRISSYLKHFLAWCQSGFKRRPTHIEILEQLIFSFFSKLFSNTNRPFFLQGDDVVT